jgi:hypothetical protein
MQNHIIAVIVGGVWLSAIGTTVAATWALNRPLAAPSVIRSEIEATSPSPPGGTPPQADEETAEPATLEMPMVTIVGHYSSLASPAPSRSEGVAEMQPSAR